MRLKISENKKQGGHKDLASCVGWSSAEEVFTCGDDHCLLKWNVTTEEAVKLLEFHDTFFPTDMHWYPRSGDVSVGKKGGSDVLAIGSTDGKFHFVTRIGRLEKSVEAHTGAILCIRWSPDGGAMFTGGEDGLVKVWSRSGMLRSTLAQNPVPVYSGAWGPKSDQILYSCGKQLVVKSIQPSMKPNYWKAHDGIILRVDWSPNTDLIVSGGEDCKYKVWNSYGTLLYSNASHDYPITCLAWSPDGVMLAVGSYDTLRLCDKNGWSYSLDKPHCGSVMGLAWSIDSTQLAAACGSGKILFGHVTDIRLEWQNFVAVMTDDRHLTVNNVMENSVEKLEFRDRIVKMSFRFGHLLVATSSSFYVYNTRNWNTPIILDLKESKISLIVQCEKNFLLIDGSSMMIYSNEGRLLCTPKSNNIQPETVQASSCSISNDTIAVRDKQDDKVIHLFDSTNGKPCGDGKPITHKMGVSDLALDQSGSAPDRRLMLIDKNRDMYIYTVRSYGQSRRVVKLGTMVSSISVHDTCPALAAVSGEKLIVWCYPNIAFIDKELLSRSTIDKQITQFGSEPAIISYSGNTVTFRKQEGTVVSVMIPPYVTVFHKFLSSNKWNEAVTLCRSVKVESLWCCLACAATGNKDMDIAQLAYAALNEVDKIEHIENVKRIPIKEARQAEMLLISGNIQDAEGLLLQAGLIFRAIMLQLRMYNWDRALELCNNNAQFLPLVLAYRKHFLERLDRQENNKNYLKFEAAEVPDWDEIQSHVKKWEQEERKSS